MVFLKKLVLGQFGANCFILGCETTREAVIIDPGEEPELILSAVEKEELKVKYLVFTHAHLDHVGAARQLKEKTGASICMHQADLPMYENVPTQAKLFGFQADAPPSIDRFLQEGDTIAFGLHQLEVIHTPGHSPGGICLYLKEPPPCLFSGDTLFKGDVGRTDLWGGNYPQLINSIKEKLLVLDNNVTVHPGHGPSTSIIEEKAENDCLK